MNKNDSYIELINMITSDRGLENITLYISDLFRKSIILTDHEFKLIHYKKREESKNDIEQVFKLNQGAAIFKNADLDSINIRLADSFDKLIDYDFNSGFEWIKLYIFPIIDDGKILAFFCCTSENDRESLDEEWIGKITNLIKIEIIKFNLKNKDMLNLRTDFVTYVLLGNITDQKEVMTLCEMNGFDYQYKRVCIFVKPARNSELSQEELRRREADIISQINKVCLKEELHKYKLTYNNNIIVFLLFNKDKDNIELNHYGNMAAQMIQKSISEKDIKVQCGVGKCYEGVDTLGRSFKQAVKAINLGEKLFPDKNVYSYFEDFIYYVLYDGMSYAQLIELYEDTILKLDKADEEFNSELTLTLKSYFECKFRSNETAKKLHLHRNTLSYRLEKVRDILGCDFEDMKNNIRIQMGLYSKELLEIYDQF